MKKEKRLKQIEDELKGKPCPKKRVLAGRLGISLGTLSQYLAYMKRTKKIAYMRSKDDPNRVGCSYIVLNA